jgi:uncharacterized membrane protein YedE/YeeE
MRKLLFLICVLATPCTSWAQNTPASWENLNTIPAGEKIQVVEMNSKKVSGTFVSVSEAAISLQEEGGTQTIQRQDVRSVKLTKRQDLLRNTLIVGGVGAGIGAGLGAGTYGSSPKCCATKGQIAGLSALIGFVGGAIVGALVPDHKTIYRVSAH